MRPMAKTMPKATMMESSQLSFRKSPSTGISLTSGCALSAKTKASTAAPIQPAIAMASRTRPRE